MSNLSDYVGGGGVSLYGLTPIKPLSAFATSRSIAAGSPLGNGESMLPGSYTGAWSYLNADATTKFTVADTDIHASSTAFLGVCYLANGNLLFATTDNPGTNVYVGEISASTGLLVGSAATIALALPIAPSSAEERNFIQHKNDLSGYYIKGDNDYIEIDNSFTLVGSSTPLVAHASSIMILDDATFKSFKALRAQGSTSEVKSSVISVYAGSETLLAAEILDTGRELGVGFDAAGSNAEQAIVTYADGSMWIYKPVGPTRLNKTQAHNKIIEAARLLA
ncbi:hypothetical protein [Pontibacterium sp.]|uniref:hypothetical protein n=1 Tax=Pontibacterium sp. TaxID=2036026 RepID=UPI00356516C6